MKGQKYLQGERQLAMGKASMNNHLPPRLYTQGGVTVHIAIRDPQWQNGILSTSNFYYLHGPSTHPILPPSYTINILSRDA